MIDLTEMHIHPGIRHHLLGTTTIGMTKNLPQRTDMYHRNPSMADGPEHHLVLLRVDVTITTSIPGKCLDELLSIIKSAVVHGRHPVPLPAGGTTTIGILGKYLHPLVAIQ